MIKRLLAVVVLVAAVAGLYFFWQAYKVQQPNDPQTKAADQPNVNVAPARDVSTTIFVPYWFVADGAVDGDYDRSVYFGITSTRSGINKFDQGYLNISDYNELFPTGEKLLAVRTLNSDLNLAILEDPNTQESIISGAIETAQENGFSGVVLDFELSGLSGFFNEEVPGQINDFVTKFSQNVKQNNLYFAVTIYGDVFYRKRPFDVGTLANHVDEVMIMAYDFSKSKGEPGPNFPLNGREKYGYDLKAMLQDFLAVAPAEKLSVIFGMYGYDWTVDEKKRPIKPAEALSDNEIRKNYLDICDQKSCVVLKDELSQETEINFVDSRNVAPSGFVQNHIVWFEDLESARTKQQYLRSQGIGNFAYWAYGYF